MFTHEFQGSSNISAFEYSNTEEYLVVKFNRGAVYGYKQVPSAVIEGWLLASSAGQYFNQYIKGQYDYQQLNGPAGPCETTKGSAA